MNIKILCLLALWCTQSVLCDRSYRPRKYYGCSRQSAWSLEERHAYTFSTKLLRRISEATDSHFVFSPLSTWLQMTALAEGATGRTYKEIMNVTKQHRNKCYRKKLKSLYSSINRDLRNSSSSKSIIAINQLMSVKKDYIRAVERLYGVKVLLLNFDNPKRSALQINHATEEGTNGLVHQIIYDSDFDLKVLLMSDANCFHCNWLSVFDPVYTSMKPFYTDSGLKVGEVDMMNQIGNFNMLEFPHIGAKVLELQCDRRNVSTLIFLPTNKGLTSWIGEIFYRLEHTTLTSIFNEYERRGKKLVNVSIPKFKLRTEFDILPEILSDLGLDLMFDTDFAQFKGISDYKLYVSLMTQISQIEINEGGISAGVGQMAKSDDSEEFNANRPFAFMVVHKKYRFILYAGVYSKPGVEQ